MLIPADADAMRRNNFDAIRLAMALLVIWSHCFAIYYGSEANEPISRLMGGHYNAGNVGVWVFFIISGFLITHSYVRSPDLLAYLRRRVARIHPGFIVARSRPMPCSIWRSAVGSVSTTYRGGGTFLTAPTCTAFRSSRS